MSFGILFLCFGACLGVLFVIVGITLGRCGHHLSVLGGFLDSLGSSLGPWGRHKSDLCGLGLRLLRIPPSLRSFVFEVQWGRIQIFIFFKVSSEIIFDVWQAEIEVITSSISDLVAQLGE